ncbi:MAG: polyprenol monophosphomannose synthase [Candidatus Bathyarchaeota archaeon]|nr:polyprenol monophosphomannose synthase [Candidatus Bathyarchaeota archaeon A05DMB-3]MDH7607366.1 polyprenol monophosphomannose synthase [Candidatus Bathyarchaeota archaeon]
MNSQGLEGNTELNAEVGIILPTYCEAQNIEKLIGEIESLKMDASILVIDDSSDDGTAEIVRKLQKRYNNILLFTRPQKLGLGTAITDGFKIFMSLPNPPKYIVTMDADYSHNPRDIPRLVSSLKRGYCLVVGSRYCRGGYIVNWSVLRFAISKIANLIAALVVGAKISDYTSGLRCYSISLIQSIIGDLHSQTYEIQIETIRQARIRKFRVGEISITFINRKKGKSKLTINEVKQFFSYIFKAAFKK